MDNLDKIIGDERVLWSGKPKFIPFFFTNLSITIYFLLILIIFIALGIIYPEEIDSGLLIIYVMIALVFLIYPILNFFVTHYAITDKRVIIQNGIIGRDFKIIDFDKITNI